MDDNMKLWIVLVGVIVILSVFATFMSYKAFDLSKRYKAYVDLCKRNLTEDLELATSDQLLAEMRSRPGNPYLYVSPVEDEDQKGLKIEVHGISPVSSMQMLHFAAVMTLQELKNRGFEIPDNPFPVEGDEWKNKEEE